MADQLSKMAATIIGSTRSAVKVCLHFTYTPIEIICLFVFYPWSMIENKTRYSTVEAGSEVYIICAANPSC